MAFWFADHICSCTYHDFFVDNIPTNVARFNSTKIYLICFPLNQVRHNQRVFEQSIEFQQNCNSYIYCRTRQFRLSWSLTDRNCSVVVSLEFEGGVTHKQLLPSAADKTLLFRRNYYKLRSNKLLLVNSNNNCVFLLLSPTDCLFICGLKCCDRDTLQIGSMNRYIYIYIYVVRTLDAITPATPWI